MLFKKIFLLSFVLCGLVIPGYLFIKSITDSNSTLNAEYEIWWSGTEVNQNKVDDHAKGDFEVTKNFVCNEIICFEYETNDPDSLKIKIWVNIEANKLYVCKYEIKADYSYLEKDNIREHIPCIINGSGNGSWDWKDEWKIKIKEVKAPVSLWTIEDYYILGNLFYFLIIGICFIYYYYKFF